MILVRNSLFCRLVLGLAACTATTLSWCVAGRGAEGGKALSANDVKALQQKFQSERAAAQKAGSAAKFSPELFKQVDLLAKQGDTDLAAGRLHEALEAYRSARWY